MTAPITQDALYAEWTKYLESAEPSGSGLTTNEIYAMLSSVGPISRGGVDTFLQTMVAQGRVRTSQKRVPTRIGRLTTVPSYIFLPEDKPEPKKDKKNAR